MPLQRTRGTFIYPSGLQRDFTILQDNSPAKEDAPCPPKPSQEVILTFGGRRRVSRRDRLAHLEIDELVSLFCFDFGIRAPHKEGSLLDEGFSLTFYHQGRGNFDGASIAIDPATWYELLRSVSRIDIKKPTIAIAMRAIAGPPTPVPEGSAKRPFWYKHANAAIFKLGDAVCNAAAKQIKLRIHEFIERESQKAFKYLSGLWRL